MENRPGTFLVAALENRPGTFLVGTAKGPFWALTLLVYASCFHAKYTQSGQCCQQEPEGTR
jgi:hypothetical protein